MLYTVEVRLIGGEFIASMAQMRSWLDHQRIEPDAFRHSSGGAGVTFRIDFKVETEAEAFARAFGGRLIGLPPVLSSSPNLLWPSAVAAPLDAPVGTPLAMARAAAAPTASRKRQRA
jgi:hypothetical protein